MSDQTLHYDILIVGSGKCTDGIAFHILDEKCAAGITPCKSNYSLPIERGPFEDFPVRYGMTFCFSGHYAADEIAGGL